MFNIFKKRSPKEQLQKKYEALTKEAYKLSHTNRTAGDAKLAEAEAILKQIEALES